MARKIAKHLSNEKAFTLIEVIASMVLMGILVTIVGLGLVQISKGYNFARQNSETVQKVQIAMARIVKELGAATSISAATATSITYTRPTTITNTILIDNSDSTVKISGGILINKVVAASSSFAYFDAAGNTTTIMASIRRIDVTLRVTGADNISSDFTNSVWINESYQ